MIRFDVVLYLIILVPTSLFGFVHSQLPQTEGTLISGFVWLPRILEHEIFVFLVCAFFVCVGRESLWIASTFPAEGTGVREREREKVFRPLFVVFRKRKGNGSLGTKRCEEIRTKILFYYFIFLF